MELLSVNCNLQQTYTFVNSFSPPLCPFAEDISAMETDDMKVPNFAKFTKQLVDLCEESITAFKEGDKVGELFNKRNIAVLGALFN